MDNLAPLKDETVGPSPSAATPLIVWVGDRPGLVEDERRRLWVGPAGQLLRTGYLQPRTHNHLTNLLDTYTPGKPPSSTYTAAHPSLLSKLKAHAPTPAPKKILVLMGAEPARFLHHIDKSFPASITKALSHQLRPLDIDGTEWTVLFTYNPAHLLESPNLARAADNHVSLLKLFLNDRLPPRTRPTIVPTRGPRPSDPRTIVLDIETYGAVTHFSSGNPSPTQKETRDNGRFHPARSLYEDRPERLVCTVSITLPDAPTPDHRFPLKLFPSETFPHSRETIAALRPGPTITFNMERSDHRALVGKWLRHAQTILGHNLLFDLQYLTFSEPIARAALQPFSKSLIDTTHLLYLYDETTPEKSLKAAGPLQGLYRYDPETSLEHHRYRNPSDRLLHLYNAEDTHNTLLLAASTASLIVSEWTSVSSKADPECLAFYNRTLWTSLAMLEKGVPFSTPALVSLQKRTEAISNSTYAYCKARGVQISGTGSKASKDDFITAIVTSNETLQNHPLLELTEKRKEISTGVLNLKLCQYHLPKHDARYYTISAWIRHLSANKLLSSYIYPLLYANSKNLKSKKFDRTKVNRTSTLIPEIPPCSPFYLRSLPTPFSSESPSGPSSNTELNSPDANADAPTPFIGRPVSNVAVAYPRIYITPSTTTDSSDDEGGTEQMRLVFKGPALQTIPPEIQGCQTSRLRGNLLWEMDLSQIEMRVPALLSGEPKLIEAFESGLDLHTDRAIAIFTETYLRELLGVGASETISKKTEGFDDYRQIGKAQPLSEVIQTPDGPRPLRDLKVGDEVFGSNGQPTKITHIYPQGVKPVYTLTFGDGSSTRACAEHLWAARQAQNTLTKIYSTQDFIDNPSRRFEIPLANPVDYGWDIDLEIPPYVLGAFLGDGSIVAGTPQIANHLNDQEIVDKISSLLEGWNLRIFRPDPDEVSVSFATEIKGRTYINPLKHAFQAIGVWGQGAYQKHIPEQYLRASYQDRLELLRGLMDTDGTISEGNSASFSTVSNELAAQVQQLIFSLGGTCRLKRKKGTYKGRVYSSWNVDAIRTPECPFSLARKAARWQPLRLFRRLLSVKPAGSEECACIRVEADDHLYLTKDFIVTHNTANFSDQFWATAPTMQKTVFRNSMVYAPIHIFNRAVESRPTTMPTFYKWQESLQTEATKKGFLDVPFLGLTRHFVGGSRFHLNKILNFRVQALAAATLIDIQHRFVARQTANYFATYQVYDSLKGELAAGYEDELRATLEACVEETATIGLWGRLQALHNRKIPLEYDFKVKPGAAT
jgi:uracil-DNA glycosylase